MDFSHSCTELDLDHTPLMVALSRHLHTMYTMQECTNVTSSAYTPGLL